MTQLWKAGVEKPCLLEDEDGGAVFLSAPLSSSSG
uniref:Uncharacterized protein n=1 Tax=Rhizophora mucronata TaxID=61149 RepID=A0A2P2P8H3_RHIMU